MFTNLGGVGKTISGLTYRDEKSWMFLSIMKHLLVPRAQFSGPYTLLGGLYEPTSISHKIYETDRFTSRE